MVSIPLIKPHELFGREAWTEIADLRPGMGALLVTHCWGIIVAAMAMFLIWPNALTYILAVMIIGTRQLGLAVLMHDGAHGLLSKNQRFNNLLGGALSGSFIGAELIDYRNYHLQHHKFAMQSEDPDLGLSKNFPVSKDSMRRKIIRDLSGQTFFKQRIGPYFSKDNIDKSVGVTNKFLLANCLMFSGFLVAGIWWAYFALWLVPLATWNPLVTRLRNIAEHACLANDPDPWRVARTTIANPVESFFLAPYWVNYHSEHHLFMYVPCYRLGAVHKALSEQNKTDKMVVAHGYRSVLREASSFV